MRFFVRNRRKIVIGFIVVLSFFFFLFLQEIGHSAYIGLAVGQDERQHWIVKKVYPGSLADRFNIPIDSQIISIDNRKPAKNFAVKKWHVVEQARELKVINSGQQLKYIFPLKNQHQVYQYLSMATLASIAVLLGIVAFYKQPFSRKVLYFSLFSVLNGVAYLSAIACSEGLVWGRICFFLSMAWLPLTLMKFVRYFLIKESPSRGESWLETVFKWAAAIGTILLCIHLLFQLPAALIEMLESQLFMPFFVSLVASVSMLQVHLFKYASQKEKYQDLLFSLALVISYFPFYLFYIFAGKNMEPFIVTVLFFPVNLIVAFFILVKNHVIILSWSFPIFIFRIGYSVLTIVLFYNLFIFLNEQNKWMIAFFSVILSVTFYLFYQKLDSWNQIRRSKALKPFDHLEIDINDNFVILAKEKEREQIMIQLHDNVIQKLVYIIRNLREAEKQKDNRKMIKPIIDHSEEMLFQLRELCTDIYPSMIEDLGLKKTIFSFAKEMMKNHMVNITLQIDQCDEKRIMVPVKHEVFRMMKELVVNAIKHAEAKQINILLLIDQKWITLNVEDNGKGMDEQTRIHKSIGLTSIKKETEMYGGSLRLLSKKGQGTKVMINIPLIQKVASSYES